MWNFHVSTTADEKLIRIGSSFAGLSSSGLRLAAMADDTRRITHVPPRERQEATTTRYTVQSSQSISLACPILFASSYSPNFYSFPKIQRSFPEPTPAPANDTLQLSGSRRWTRDMFDGLTQPSFLIASSSYRTLPNNIPLIHRDTCFPWVWTDLIRRNQRNTNAHTPRALLACFLTSHPRHPRLPDP